MSIRTVVIIVLLVIANVNAFLIMAYDKKRAREGKWRVPEKKLFLVAGLFGGFGATLGMVVMDHKTKHWYFVLFFPLMMILQAVILFLFFRAAGV